MMVGVYGQIAYFDYDTDIAIVAFGAYPIAKDALLVQSLGALIDAVLAALQTEKPLLQPNLNVLMIMGR
jgi:hypothetical protein